MAAYRRGIFLRGVSLPRKAVWSPLGVGFFLLGQQGNKAAAGQHIEQYARYEIIPKMMKNGSFLSVKNKEK